MDFRLSKDLALCANEDSDTYGRVRGRKVAKMAQSQQGNVDIVSEAALSVALQIQRLAKVLHPTNKHLGDVSGYDGLREPNFHELVRNLNTAPNNEGF